MDVWCSVGGLSATLPLTAARMDTSWKETNCEHVRTMASGAAVNHLVEVSATRRGRCGRGGVGGGMEGALRDMFCVFLKVFMSYLF